LASTPKGGICNTPDEITSPIFIFFSPLAFCAATLQAAPAPN